MESKKALPILIAIMFLVMVGFGIIIPVLPFYAEELGASPFELGMLMAIYSIMQFIFAPIWGRISDRIGRKPVILIGILGLAISFFMMALSNDLLFLFIARLIGGVLSSANMPTVMAYVADITTEETRSKGMGMIGAATGLGFIFGPAIGGIFSQSSLHLPFYIAAGSSFLTFLLVIFILKESLTPEKRNISTHQKKSLLSSLVFPTSVLFFLQLFISISLSGLEATFAFLAAEKADLHADKIGYIFMIMGLAQAVMQGGVMGMMSKKFGDGLVIKFGIIVSAIGFGLIIFVNNFLTAALFLTIFGIGNGIIRPSISSILTKQSTSGHGSATGVLSSFDSLGRIIGPTLGGWLYLFSVDLPYISGILLSIVALVLYQVYAAKTKHLELRAS